ncbi:MAG: TadE/TadG family type IV pilus assembly protein [Bdellovibrionales bacterium]
MFQSTLKKLVLQCARRFIAAESGMTLPLLALSMVVITGMTGLAIDTARMQLSQAKLQFSLDAAGLAAGSTVNTSALSAEVTKYLNANFEGYMGATVTGCSATVNDTNTIISLSATATMPTTFMGTVGVDTITVTANAQVTRAVTGLELIMVLDTTGSMSWTAGQGVTKIAALKTAATALVNTMFGSKDTAEKLWIGIVPFSQAVNIGTGHSAWMDDTYNSGLSWPTDAPWEGCVDARGSGYDVTDDPPSALQTATLFRQYYWPTDSNNCWLKTKNTSGNYKCSAVGTEPVYVTPMSASTRGPNYLCPKEVQLMTNQKQPLLDKISSLTARGNTLVNQGLIWGWHMISPRWRGFWGGAMDGNSLPLDYNTKNMVKAVVLLTDGENTQDNSSHSAYWFLKDNKLGTTSGSAAIIELDRRTKEICTQMKSKGIYIYSIALGTDLPASSLQLLKDCASSASFYFYSPSTSQLEKVFSAIGDSLSNLRVSK